MPLAQKLLTRACLRRLLGTIMGAAVTVLAVAGADASARPASRVAIAVRPSDVLLDPPVQIRVSGLRPNEAVVLRARTTGAEISLSSGKKSAAWVSDAAFHADGRGQVDPSRSRASAGSYSGRDAMGLLWSMRPAGSPSGVLNADLLPRSGPSTVWLEALVGGRIAATARFTRRTVLPSVRTTPLTLARDGLVGRFWFTPGASPTPAVLLLGGSEGGLASGLMASLLASHGYPALQLAYFGAPGLPQQLKEIPLEYFQRALRWLAAQPGVDPRRVVIVGGSRGGEAALLIGSTYPELVHGVVAYVPSSVVNPSPDGTSPAWTLAGKPVPHVDKSEFGKPNPPLHPDAIIPLERIGGPLLLVSGDADKVWPSRAYAKAIVERLRAHGRSEVVSLVYHGAGHRIGVPNLPVAPFFTGRGVIVDFGGSVVADAAASERSWPLVLRFLAALQG